MKRNYILGVAILVMLSSLLIIGCDLDDDEKKPNNPFKGTWRSNEGYMAFFEDYSWEVPHYQGGVGLKGIYIYDNNTATVTYQEITNNGIDWRAITSSEASNYTRTATVSGNKLTWGATTYTRR